MTNDKTPILLWYRRDLRIEDHPALTAACAQGRPVIPVFLCDGLVDGLGTAPKWRLEAGLEALGAQIRSAGSRLILRRGDALAALQALIAETGAGAVYWTRLYDPDTRIRDEAIKSALREQGVEARSFGGHVLFEPWTVQTKTGGFYKVYSPMWRAVRQRPVDAPLPAPAAIPAPEAWPASDTLSDWQLGRDMRRGDAVLRPYLRAGTAAAQDRLAAFLDGPLDRYAEARDLPAEPGTSELSEHLALGEISPQSCWHAVEAAQLTGSRGEAFLRQLVWRDFAWHLTYHTPHLLTENWREGWESFPWSQDPDDPHLLAWQQGRTGIRFVDAAMREMFVTGRMHNRARMIAASYLTKHLMVHWRMGLRWFEDCLIDWDPACNAMGWQWVAGCGPDAAPYFRIFNPDGQAQKFDPKGVYDRRWIAEGSPNPSTTALSYFEAVPRRWGLVADAPYPSPIVPLAEGRARALAAYETRPAS